jgi:nitrate reductase delta subunit
MHNETIEAGYRLGSELMLHPEKRDEQVVDNALDALGDVDGLRTRLDRFLDDALAYDRDEYIRTLELSPPCPLYLGTYLYDEPESCREAGLSDRNQYMLELKNLYRHFGFEPPDDELPDYLPLMTDFCRLSRRINARMKDKLRRYLLETHFVPGLGPFQEKLAEYESPYRHVVEAIGRVARVELEQIEVPAWQPPSEDEQQEQKGQREVSSGHPCGCGPAFSGAQHQCE